MSEFIEKCDAFRGHLQENWFESHTNLSSTIESVQEAEHILISISPGSKEYAEASIILLEYASWIVEQFGPLDQFPVFMVEYLEESENSDLKHENYEEEKALMSKVEAILETLDFLDLKAQKIMGLKSVTGHQFTNADLFKWEEPLEQQIEKEMAELESRPNLRKPKAVDTAEETSGTEGVRKIARIGGTKGGKQSSN
jgi:hypothetical protein